MLSKNSFIKARGGGDNFDVVWINESQIYFVLSNYFELSEF